MVDAGWNILLVEDDEDDYFLVKTWLSQVKNGQFNLTWVSEYEPAMQMIEKDAYDVVLVDYQLGSHTGLELIRAAIKNCQHVPFILLTGRGNYDVDLTAMEAGAVDYLSKLELNAPLLERSIRYAIYRKRAERDLRKAYDKMELLLDERTDELLVTRRKLIQSVQQERKRLAQEIHDGPIQDLLGTTFLMMGKSGSVEKDEALMNVQGAISRVVDSLRDICKELRSSSLTPFNLDEAIRVHVEDFQKNHPELNVSIKSLKDLNTFPERSRLALYRIYQQAMTNVAFHARAKKVEVSVTQGHELATLEIVDDGRGFIVPECLSDLALKGHFGLVGLYDRAVAVGGELQIESKPGHGTLIRAVVPVKIRIAA